MSKVKGMQSLAFEKEVYIHGAASVVGKLEGEGPLGKYFDLVEEDPMMGADSWEEAESRMQMKAAGKALEKAGVRAEQIRMIFAGDLLAQSIASSFSSVELARPVYGLFGACSVIGEALALGTMAVAAGYADHVLAISEARKKNSAFRWPMEISVLRRQPGRLRAARPVCWDGPEEERLLPE